MKKENDLGNLKVLIVDDDITICEILKEFCEILEIKSDYIIDPLKVEEILSKDTYHIILLDQNFPNIKGIDLIKKGYIKPENFYIVMMTGQPLREDMVNNMLKLGINEFIQKPLRLNDLRKILFHAMSSILEKKYFLNAAKKLEKATMEFIIPNEISLVGAIAKMIIRNIEGFNFTENPKFLLTAIVEAISNAIIHGNLEIPSSFKDKGFKLFQEELDRRVNDEKYKDRKVYISSYLDRKIFRIKIRDDGNGFDWKSYLEKIGNINILSSYGKGISIIKSAFDEVYWNEKGNEIIMIKHPLASPIEEQA